MIFKSLRLFILVLCTKFSFGQQTIVLTITNITSNKGQVGVLLFNQAKGFPGLPQQAIKTYFIKQQNGVAKITIPNVEIGEYAISIMHDANDNQKLDKNLFGMPTEGFGISNNPKIFLGPPTFTEAMFKVGKGVTNVQIQMKYF